MQDREIPDTPTKGRGAASNLVGRFEAYTRHAIDDGWPREEEQTALKTTVAIDAARTIISKNKSPDIPFDRSINPYRGCEHGCVYCYARPTHAYLGLSPGLDFESRLFYKPNAAKLLAEELRRSKYRCDVISMGTNTDPYQPIEREFKITRSVLEVLSEFNHPVGIVTKSNLILRDLDILAQMAARGLAQVSISVTTLDRKLARLLEPRAPTPSRRLDAIRALSDAGIPTGVLAAPMIPGINDAELETIMENASKAGASTASYILLRLPLEIRDLFEEWLQNHAPLKAERVMKLVRDTRGGKTNESTFGRRMRGSGKYAEILAQRFYVAARRLNLNNERRYDLDITQFARPPRTGDQLDLF